MIKKLILGLVFVGLLLTGLQADAQISLKSPYLLSSDTAVNTTVTYLTAASTGGYKNHVTVQVNITKISGTVAGTLSLLGSIDGTNFKAILLPQVSTALNTYTATDVASQTFIWLVTGNPYTHYRVSWTPTGTMSASFNAKLLSR